MLVTDAQFGSVVFAAGGLYLVIRGLTADYLIDESETPASEEEKANAKATALKRGIVVLAGLAALTYGVVHLVPSVNH